MLIRLALYLGYAAALAVAGSHLIETLTPVIGV